MPRFCARARCWSVGVVFVLTTGPGLKAGWIPASVAAGSAYSCAVEASAGDLYCWGGNPFLLPDDPRTPQPFAVAGLPGHVRAVSLGLHHACVLSDDGSVHCWGSNRSGQLGVAPAQTPRRCVDRPCSRTPLRIEGLGAPATAIAAGGFHSCALLESGAVRCWGAGDRGQLGGGVRPEGSPSPVDVALPKKATAIAAGYLHSCALLADGSVWCWGEAEDGRLGSAGDGTAGEAPATVQRGPVRAAIEAGLAAVAAGKQHTCAAAAAGGVLCWGSNTLGELGDVTRAAHDGPIEVEGASDDVAALAAGDSFSCILRRDGSVGCWGWDLVGQLGDGEGDPTGDAFDAVRSIENVDLAAKASGIAVGYGHACAVTGDGAAWCWGMNHRGQLGDGSLTDSYRPVAVEAPGGSSPDLLTTGGMEPLSSISGGIDVSYHSGSIRWPEVAEGEHGFAFTLGTAGLTFRDPLFDYHWTHLRRNGLLRGSYHFFVLHDDPEAQARFFIDNVPLSTGDLRPVVDIETLGTDPPKDAAARLATFLAALEAHYRTKPIIYTGPVFWDTYLSDGFGEHPLWVAEYDVEEPHIPRGWQSWHLWQWKGNATVPGVSRVVDLNRFNGEKFSFTELLLGAAEAQGE